MSVMTLLGSRTVSVPSFCRIFAIALICGGSASVCACTAKGNGFAVIRPTPAPDGGVCADAGAPCDASSGCCTGFECTTGVCKPPSN